MFASGAHKLVTAFSEKISLSHVALVDDVDRSWRKRKGIETMLF